MYVRCLANPEPCEQQLAQDLDELPLEAPLNHPLAREQRQLCALRSPRAMIDPWVIWSFGPIKCARTLRLPTAARKRGALPRAPPSPCEGHLGEPRLARTDISGPRSEPNTQIEQIVTLRLDGLRRVLYIDAMGQKRLPASPRRKKRQSSKKAVAKPKGPVAKRKSKQPPPVPTEEQKVLVTNTEAEAPRVPANKGQTYKPEVLAPDEMKRLLAAPSSRAPTGIRNRALLVVLYRAGLRIAEALALLPKDLDCAASTVRVLHGKGDKARTVGMDPEAFAMVERWLDVRAARGINARAPLFCSLKGKSIAGSYVRALLPRLAKRAGIEKRVHAHGLRHTMAAEMRAEGVDIGVISKQLGHASIATTARYIDHIAPTDLIDTMRARTWDV